MYLAPIRILVTNMSQFASERRDVSWHIPSKYEDELAKVSSVHGKAVYTCIYNVHFAYFLSASSMQHFMCVCVCNVCTFLHVSN